MSYATRQADPRRQVAGIGFVILFHAALAWALVSGLARKVVTVLAEPLDVRLVEAPKPPPPVEPPPPPPPPPPPRRVPVPRPRVAPPPAFVPPPEVVVEAPAAPSIQAVQSVPAPPPEPPAPPAPPPAPPAPPPAPRLVSVGVTCPNHVSIRSSVPYPPAALQMNLSGDVQVDFIVGDDGQIGNVRIVRSSNPVFNDVVVAAVRRFQCVGQGQPVRVTVPFKFTLDN